MYYCTYEVAFLSVFMLPWMFINTYLGSDTGTLKLTVIG